ncbi:MAG: right-handed parallel beta-helix repeat-containing protein [Bacteroidales bacterium]
MKNFALLLFLALLITACGKGRISSNNQDSVFTGVALSTSADTGFVSIIEPLIPDRIITVGGNRADINGFTSEAIQTAIDALNLKGGGRVVLQEGLFDIKAPVRLYSNISLSGAGPNTILRKCDGYRSPFSLDADYGELKIEVNDPAGFSTGMGVAVFDDDNRGGWDVTTARITAIMGKTIYLDTYLLRDYRSDRNGMLSNACSVIEAFDAVNIHVASLAVDGNRATNDLVDGCREGGIYLHRVSNSLIENLVVRNFNCDGISWQTTEHITVRNCEVTGCANAGLHPGTGSPFTIIEGNDCHGNDHYGLFVCWRVRDGFVRNNKFRNNGVNGICTGHKDTNMIFEGNEISGNGEDGIHLRGETDLNAPHGSVFSGNTFTDNGLANGGYGISVNSKAKNVIIKDNTFVNTARGRQKAAIYLMKNSLDPLVSGNTLTGMPDGEIVRETK